MSGRIRQLKPDFLLDEEFWALKCAHPDLHLHEAFEGLWMHSDREGRFEWRPQNLKAKILPYWQGDFERVLQVLEEARCVVSYVVDGRRYGFCRNFGKHQRPNSREPESTLPPPPADDLQSSVRVRESARACESPRASLPPLPTPNTQHPDPESASARELESPPDVPGLTVVGAPPKPHPGPLRPSKRDREAAAPSGVQPVLRYQFRPDWWPSKAHQQRGREYGLTDEQIFDRADDCLKKPIKHGFTDEDDHFFRELGWMKRDRETQTFKSQRERDAFEMPGRERRA